MSDRRVYLVDTENVGNAWVELLDVKKSRDRVILFYTDNSPKLSYKDLECIIQHPNSYELMQCYPGKNGLDFQLISYLGFLIRSAPKTDYVIVSDDADYDPVIQFWNKQDVSVSRMTLRQLSYHTEVQTGKSVKRIEKIIDKVFQGNHMVLKQKRAISTIVAEHGPEQLAQIHTACQKAFGTKDGGTMYRIIKDHISDFYGMNEVNHIACI